MVNLTESEENSISKDGHRRKNGKCREKSNQIEEQILRY